MERGAVATVQRQTPNGAPMPQQASRVPLFCSCAGVAPGNDCRPPMRLLFRVTALSVLAALAVSLRAAPAFPQDGSDLHPDPAAKFGSLPNGLRYVVMPNHEPKGRVSLRLLVLAGSFEETEKQRGLAHFLEHMAFNGSTHYAPGTLVEKLQRLGMGFGADTNASTSFNRTLYQLELPDTGPATLADGLTL